MDALQEGLDRLESRLQEADQRFAALLWETLGPELEKAGARILTLHERGAIDLDVATYTQVRRAVESSTGRPWEGHL